MFTEFEGFISFDYALLCMFWFAVIIEIPRFLIPALYVSGRELMSRTTAFADNRIAGLSPRAVKISILLPGHNEGPSLEKSIRALREQISAPTQVVVVDDGSTDQMADVGRRLKAQGLIDVFVSTGLRGGKAAAHNLGLTYCTGEIVVIADIDTTFDRDALTRMVEPFNDPRVGAVSGNLGVRNFNVNILTRFQAILYLNAIAMGRRVNDMIYGLFIASGAFAAFRRRALDSVGGWSSGPGEDGDVTTRLRRAGWVVRFHPDAWALTDVPDTLFGLLRQRARWNRSFVMLRLRKHAQVFNPLRPNFSLINSLGTIDAIYFEVVAPATHLALAALMFHLYGTYALSIFAVLIVVYAAVGIVGYLLAVLISGAYGRLELVPYVPGALLLNRFILAPATVYAVITELLFRQGYKNDFLPSRVLNRIDRF